MTQRLFAEWEPQDAVLLAWPHKNTDWEWMLEDITQLYEALVSVICDYADIVIALPAAEIDATRARLEAMSVPLEYVYFYPVDTRDIWVRDYGPMAVQTEEGVKLLDFIFNGCGEKYHPEVDGQVAKKLQLQNAFPAAAFEKQDWVLEAGAIEVDGQGTLLTTRSCLLNENRNPGLDRAEIEKRLQESFGVSRIHWLEHGLLQGDDSDGHIDNLVRLCPNDTIVYTACDDEQDEHYRELKQLEAELAALRTASGEAYRLLPLPWPGAKFNDDDRRLLVTYANFQVVNECVLVPIYDALSDEDALEVISRAFPGLEIMGIPCTTLIERGGSLHRMLMQLPEGVLFTALG
ncbi:MAG TPA: agmatine deiminase family protein [Cellvibrio sp.]|nr:agmatine deiminase family protein [Cellvibrio sp.]